MMRKFLSSLFEKIFSVIVLMSISTMVLADDSIGSQATTDPSVTNHTDLSLNYLGQVFGSVGDVLHGSSGQMLGKLFLKLNEGIIVVAGLWLGYTVFTIVLRAAQEGSFMGANKNVALTFLKIAVGFTLLIPNPSTGYSLLQDVVMKVVVEGVGLADATWRYGLQYVDNGGTVWHRPEQSGDNDDIISNDTAKAIIGTGGANPTHGPAQQIFADEVCMYSSNDNQTVTPGQARTQFDVYTDDTNQRFNFPGLGNTYPFGSNSNACGSVSWVLQSCKKGGNNSAQCQYAKQALSQLVTNLLPAAKREYCSQHSSAALCVGINNNNVAATNEEHFFGGMVNYVNLIVPMEQMAAGGGSSAKNFISDAQRDGWMTAGRYYWDLAQVQMRYDNISNLKNYVPSTFTSITASGAPATDASTALTDSNAYITPILTKLANYRAGQNSGDTGNNYPEWGAHNGSAGTALATSILGGIVGDIINLIRMFGAKSQGGTMGYDPILFLHKVGMYCINLAGDIWLGWLGVIAAALFASGVCNAEYNAWQAIKGIINWFKPLLMVLAAGFWGVGFILGFYVPMYPYLIFTFGVIGWIIAVIEAMVAAPLVCFGLTHPEGHDFLGEAKQALMLLLGVFLRPVLMVIGLIAAMILSYVALRIVVHTFTGFATDLFYIGSPHGAGSDDVLKAAGTLMGQAMLDSTSITGFILCLLVFPLTLIIFTTLVYVITTQCFSLIFALPDNILRWIGGPAQPNQAAQMAQQMQGAIGSATSQSARGIEASKKASDDRAKIGSDRKLAKGDGGGGAKGGFGSGWKKNGGAKGFAKGLGTLSNWFNG